MNIRINVFASDSKINFSSYTLISSIMVHNEKSSLKISTHLYLKWNKKLLLVVLFSIGVFLLSCKKDSTQYYVKYLVNSSTIYFSGKLNVEIKNESGNNTSYVINQTEQWEVIIGPVEKGFTAHMNTTAVGETHGKLKIFPSIYISKENGPFTLEKYDGNDTYRDAVEISYIVE